MYKKARINLTKAQANKAIAGKAIRILPSQMGVGDHFISLHPMNAKKVEAAMLKGKGCNINMSHGELADTAMNGSGFWGDLWKGLKSTWKVLKDTGAATALADAAVGPLSATPLGPAGAAAGRRLFKSLTGAGIEGDLAAGEKSIARMSAAEKRAKLKGMGLYLS